MAFTHRRMNTSRVRMGSTPEKASLQDLGMDFLAKADVWSAKLQGVGAAPGVSEVGAMAFLLLCGCCSLQVACQNVQVSAFLRSMSLRHHLQSREDRFLLRPDLRSDVTR